MLCFGFRISIISNITLFVLKFAVAWNGFGFSRLEMVSDFPLLVMVIHVTICCSLKKLISAVDVMHFAAKKQHFVLIAKLPVTSCNNYRVPGSLVCWYLEDAN